MWCVAVHTTGFSVLRICEAKAHGLPHLNSSECSCLEESVRWFLIGTMFPFSFRLRPWKGPGWYPPSLPPAAPPPSPLSPLSTTSISSLESTLGLCTTSRAGMEPRRRPSCLRECFCGGSLRMPVSLSSCELALGPEVLSSVRIPGQRGTGMRQEINYMRCSQYQ